MSVGGLMRPLSEDGGQSASSPGQEGGASLSQYDGLKWAKDTRARERDREEERGTEKEREVGKERVTRGGEVSKRVVD